MRLTVLIIRCSLPALWVSAPAAAQPLTLDAAVRLARAHNERVRIFARRADAADARLDRARAFFFPELSATGTYTRRMNETVRELGTERAVIQARNALGAVGSLRWSVFDARGYPLYRSARHERDAARHDAVEATRAMGFDAADGFLQTLSAEQVQAAGRRRLEFAQRSLREASARFEARLVSSNDVTRAQLEVASAERELARAEASALTARLELGYLLGASTPDGLAEPTGLLATATRAAAPATGPQLSAATGRRPDVQAAREREQAAKEASREPMRRLVPSLGAFAQYRLTNETGLSGRSTDGWAGVDLTWNLFDGGERYAEARERFAQLEVARLTLQAAERRVSVEVQSAAVALQSAQRALQHARLAAEVAGRNANEAQLLYRQGLAGALEVADASVRLFEAEVALARERYGMAMAYLSFRRALGHDVLEDAGAGEDRG